MVKVKKQEEQIERLMTYIVILIIIELSLFGVYKLIIKPAREDFSAMDDFCKDKGFNKATDWKFDSPYTKIECDKGMIFSACTTFECIEQDKWFACIKEVRRYI